MKKKVFEKSILNYCFLNCHFTLPSSSIKSGKNSSGGVQAIFQNVRSLQATQGSRRPAAQRRVNGCHFFAPFKPGYKDTQRKEQLN
jgi:hypothetical protein